MRYQHPGTVYHLMARGDGGKAVFKTDEDRKDLGNFSDTAGTVYGRCDGHGEEEAGRLAGEALAKLDLPEDPKERAKLRKGDGHMVLGACLLSQRTTAGNPWIANRLVMGHSDSVSRLVAASAKHPPTMRELAKLVKLLNCDT